LVDSTILFSFNKDDDRKKQWKLEYFDTIYKVYDWDKNLAGYFFPDYERTDKEIQELSNTEYDLDEQTKIIDKLNKEKHKVNGGNLMVPLIKLYLLDNEDQIDLNFVINDLESNIQKAKKWKEWISQNQSEFNLVNNSIYTSREDRNMLSIVIGINTYITLGEREILSSLKPILNKLHIDGLL
jgi:hypothetical protein